MRSALLCSCIFSRLSLPSVYLIDDVFSSLDAHVAKHIVKHCILGLLKDKTRIIATENQTLFYYSNQILHIDYGTVSTSDFALGSFESENVESSSASSDEMGSPISFDLCTDEFTQENASAFDVMPHFSSISNSTKLTDTIFISQEIKETGSISLRVILAYWNAWGSPLGSVVGVSLFLMQSSKNFSDLWLAFWSRSRDTPSNATEILNAGQFNTSSYAEHFIENVMCIFDNLLHIENERCDFGHFNGRDAASLDSFYLAIYAGAALVNSLLTLLRAISFAYAGLKAAKFIHNRLLKSVFYVRFINSLLLIFP